MKGFVIVVVLVVAGYLVYRWTRTSPERRACNHMAKLCGANRAEADKCVDGMKKMKRMLGEKSVQNFIECTDDSKSCPDAIGCGAGTVMKDGAGELLRGLDRALHQ